MIKENITDAIIELVEDYFENKIVIIEWAENLNDKFDLGFQIKILYIDENTRKYIISWKE